MLYIGIEQEITRNMSYKIIDIEGIGETYGHKLNLQGVHTTNDLLDKCGTKHGRAAMAAATHIPESLILTWVNPADLMRINGIAGQISELMEASGVDSVVELRTRNAANLHQKMHEVNEQYGLSGKVPSEHELVLMIEQAKKMEPRVQH
jgi:predicted flap endonuclease-1-like 5' DNA nuclease